MVTGTCAVWLLGVDGGGTGTRALLAGPDARVLAHGYSGPSALALGVAPAWRAIGEAGEMAFQTLGERFDWSRCAIACGLAGANHDGWRSAFIAAAPPVRSLTVTSDAHTALLGAHGGKPGVIVALGTGSVGAVWLPGGRWRAVGGFGFPAGDEASGAWLGLQAVRHTQRALDGRSPRDSLATAVSAACATGPAAGLSASAERARLVEWLGDATQARYAALAPLLFEHAQTASAARILARAGAEIAAMLDALDPPGALPAALCGGLAEPLTPYVPDDRRRRLVAPLGSSAHGALYLAANDLTGAAAASIR